jgi:hypothetical protein
MIVIVRWSISYMVQSNGPNRGGEDDEEAVTSVVKIQSFTHGFME